MNIKVLSRLTIPLAFLAFTIMAANAADSCISPLPKYKITTPAEEMPKDISRFVGVWNGYWEDNDKDALCHTLVVKKVALKGKKIKVWAIYSHGTYAGWDINKGNYSSYKGRIKDNKLTLKLKNGRSVSYQFTSDNDILVGIYNKGTFGEFVRQ